MTNSMYFFGKADMRVCSYFPHLYNLEGRITYTVDGTNNVLKREYHVRSHNTAQWMPVPSRDVDIKSYF